MSERPVVFSASSVNAYLDCRLRWYFQYVLMEEGEQSEAQAVGIAVHDYAETLLRAMGLNNQTILTADGTGHTDFDTFWAAEKESASIGSLVAVFITEVLPTYRNPVLIEAPFQIEVNGIPFSGIIDSVDRQDIGLADTEDGLYIGPIQHDPALCKPGRCPGPTGCWCIACERGEHPALRYANILRDLKTTSRRPSPGRYHFNMTGYWLGARELGYEPDIMQLDYIVRTQRPYYWPEVVPAPDENELEAWAAILSAVARGVESGDYSPTGLGTRACVSCPHRAICGPYTRYKEATDA